MKNYLSIMLFVSMFNFIYAADTQSADCKLLFNLDNAALKELAARRVNSLMEAYMKGDFTLSKNENCLKYDDYETCANHEESCIYEDTVKEINDQLLAMYEPIKYAIDGWRPLTFHIILAQCKDKQEKIFYLQKLQEVDKIHIQTLRLYDFLKCINMDVPDTLLQDLQKLTEDKDLSNFDKRQAVKNLMDPLDEAAAGIKANRLMLAKAVKIGSARQVLDACKKPLHIARFVPLNVAIAKMITDIQAGEDNVLLHNFSRAQEQCMIN